MVDSGRNDIDDDGDQDISKEWGSKLMRMKVFLGRKFFKCAFKEEGF